MDLETLAIRINRASQIANAHNKAVVTLRAATTVLFLLSFLFLLLASTILAPHEVEIIDVDPVTGELVVKRRDIIYFDIRTMNWQSAESMLHPPETAISPEGCLEWTFALAVLMAVMWLIPASRSLNLSFLDDIGDPRAAGDLAVLLESKDPGTRRAVTATLGRLLPKLTQEQSEELDGQQRAHLRRAIRIGSANNECAFQMAAIHTLARCADSLSVPVLRSLAGTFTSNNSQERVRAVAIQCLPGLERAVEEQKHRLTLLRPIDAADALVRVADPPTDSLPRIAHGVSTDPTHLLRPH